MESLMKNIINNEQLISIAALKKQAKIARKQNNQLSNHSESLKAIAKEYNYDSWEKLLDASYLAINKPKQSFQSGQIEQIHWHNNQLLDYLSGFTRVMKNFHDEYEFLNNVAGYNALFNFFQDNVLNAHQVTSPIYQRIKLLIDFMISSFIESPIEKKEFKNILNYAEFSKKNPYCNYKLSKNSEKRLKKYMNLNNLNIHIFSENQEIQIEDTFKINDLTTHNEIILILNSIQEKINIMATVYDVIENNKKDNIFLNNWLTHYENLISLSDHSEWLARDVKAYTTLIRQYSGSFFDTEMHKEALSYLHYYKNAQYQKEFLAGTKKEVIAKIQKMSSDKNNVLKYDIEKAHGCILGDTRNERIEFQNYEFAFYYIIH